MQTVTIKKQNAFKAYQAADAAGKKMLETLLGAESVKPTDIRELINNWSDILRLTGADPDDYFLRPGETDDELANRQSKLIAKAYNQGEELDPANPKQPKYYPWHEVVKDDSKPSGFGLSYDGFAYWNSFSTVGVRHCFVRADDAIDAGKKFIEIYERQKIR